MRTPPTVARCSLGIAMMCSLPVFYPMHSMSQYGIPRLLVGVFVKLLSCIGLVVLLQPFFLLLTLKSSARYSVTKIVDQPSPPSPDIYCLLCWVVGVVSSFAVSLCGLAHSFCTFSVVRHLVKSIFMI